MQPLTGSGLWGRPSGSLRHLLHKVDQKDDASRRGFSSWTSPQVPKPKIWHVSCWPDGHRVRDRPRTLFLHFCFQTLPQTERDVASSKWGMCICPQHRNSPQQNHSIWGSQMENDLPQTKILDSLSTALARQKHFAAFSRHALLCSAYPAAPGI